MLTDVWALNAGGWQAAPISGAPSARVQHQMAMIDGLGVVVAFGGGCGSACRDGFVIAGPTSRPLFMNAPVTATYQGLVFHQGRGALLSVVGTGETVRIPLDGGSIATEAGTTTLQRERVAISYDTRRQQAVLFGGMYAGASVRETRELSTSGPWVITATTGPPEMNTVGMAYDPQNGRTVMCGLSSGNPFCWVYGGPPY
jgi:hypothetical protein